MNTLHKQFYDSLRREGKKVKGHYSNAEYLCLFRKNRDGNNLDNHVTIYYDSVAGIYQGQILDYNGKSFLVLNQETIENDVYYRSSCVECNIIVPFIVNGTAYKTPCYVEDINSPYLNEGKIITTLDGTGIIQTEYTDVIGQLSIDGSDILKILDRDNGWYNITNRYERNNIAKIIIERGQRPLLNYSLDISMGKNQIIIDEEIELSVTAKVKDDKDWYEELEKQTYNYISSDNTVATVDNGIVKGIKSGDVTISVVWVEHNIISTINIKVGSDAVDYTMIIEPSSDELYLGYKNILTPKLLDGGTEIGFVAQWVITYGDVNPSNVTIEYDGNILKITVAKSKYEEIDNTIVFTCTDPVTTTVVSIEFNITTL